MNRPGRRFASFSLPQNALAWITALSLAFFIAASFACVRSQGIHEDDGRRGLHTLEFLSQLAHPASQPWRLMESYYVGTLNSFLLMPSIGLLGPTRLALRLPYILLALAAMGLMFVSLRRLFQTPTALLAICLLAVNSSWIRPVRLGGYREEVLQVFLFWLMFTLLVVPRRPRWDLAAFTAGLALWAKIMFAGYLVGLAAAVAVFGPVWNPAGQKGLARWRALPAAAMGLALGLAPLLYWNYANGWATFQKLFLALGRPADGEVLCDNLHVLAALWERLLQLIDLLTSQITLLDFDGAYNPVANWLYFALFFAALAGVAAFSLSRAGSPLYQRRMGFLLVLYGVLFLCTIQAPVTRFAGHLTILLPLPEITIAFCVCQVAPAVLCSRRARGVLVLLLAAHGLIETGINVQVIDRLLHGRVDEHEVSPAMFDIARDLLERGGAPPENRRTVCTLLTLCNDLGCNIGYLSGDRVQTEYVYQTTREEALLPVQALRDFPAPIFLLRVENEPLPQPVPRWIDALRASGRGPEPCATFESPGYVFRLYRLAQPAGDASTPRQENPA